MVSGAISILSLAFAGLSYAQTTTISLYIPGADTQPLIGSIVGSDAAATTYALSCIDSDTCGYPAGLTLTEGPSTAAYTLSEGPAFTGFKKCSLAGTSTAVCFESNGGSEANFPGSSTETYTGTDFTYMPVTITDSAGAAATSNSEVIKSGSSATTATTTGPEASQTGATMSSTASGSGIAASQSGSTSTSSSHAGVPAVTENAMLALGVAAAMAVLG
ncbi:hypothetical protein L207DRAFT_587840 [Hyaloscypha variabilis F]|uniref:GPI anchored protein n=1 Tax=Hyaloscypha variabilis (strain UAMH 11265 / GT02V1 / F) TaxID=1149755 RepID=A0A2J6RAJ5_HYAVF|nr:hypothetical protein L207DRAFT_587840 [Hyaloscypha variabilis F]